MTEKLIKVNPNSAQALDLTAQGKALSQTQLPPGMMEDVPTWNAALLWTAGTMPAPCTLNIFNIKGLLLLRDAEPLESPHLLRTLLMHDLKRIS